MPVFLAVFLADSNLEKNTCFLGETNLLLMQLTLFDVGKLDRRLDLDRRFD